MWWRWSKHAAAHIHQPTTLVNNCGQPTVLHTQLSQYNRKMEELLKRLREAQRRRTLYTRFSESPVQAINEIIATNSRELRNAKGGGKQCEAISKVRWLDGCTESMHNVCAGGAFSWQVGGGRCADLLVKALECWRVAATPEVVYVLPVFVDAILDDIASRTYTSVKSSCMVAPTAGPSSSTTSD